MKRKYKAYRLERKKEKFPYLQMFWLSMLKIPRNLHNMDNTFTLKTTKC